MALMAVNGHCDSSSVQSNYNLHRRPFIPTLIQYTLIQRVKDAWDRSRLVTSPSSDTRADAAG